MKRNKERISSKKYVVLIAFIVCIFLAIIVYFIVNNNKTNSSSNDGVNEEEYNDDDFLESSVKPFDSEKKINVIINNIEYTMNLENNLAALDLISVLPIDLEMDDLNNNEKYNYLSYSLTSDNSYTGKITKGDVMLYQSNCLVIFYKDFETDYSYTRIGHIDNLPDFDNQSILVTLKN